MENSEHPFFTEAASICSPLLEKETEPEGIYLSEQSLTGSLKERKKLLLRAIKMNPKYS